MSQSASGFSKTRKLIFMGMWCLNESMGQALLWRCLENMSNKELDYDNPHYCPVYKRIIVIDLCYDSLNCLNGSFKVSSTNELSEISDIENARRICAKCPYSDLS